MAWRKDSWPLSAALIGICLVMPAVASGEPAGSGWRSTDTVTGGLPLILLAPHGSTASIPGAPQRTGAGVRNFTTERDIATDLLVERLAADIAREAGVRPYVVIARFSRRFADVNRRPEDAYEGPEAGAAYNAYHAAIRAACADVVQRWGQGLLIDVHGQPVYPRTVVQGTHSGQTIARLRERVGPEVLNGPGSLVGRLAMEGLTVMPRVGQADVQEPQRFGGGFTVATYGGVRGCGVDAIQLEFGTSLRDRVALESTSHRAARGILAFVRANYPTP
jgi:N-formylglutamate amidohydrolase